VYKYNGYTTAQYGGSSCSSDIFKHTDGLYYEYITDNNVGKYNHECPDKLNNSSLLSISVNEDDNTLNIVEPIWGGFLNSSELSKLLFDTYDGLEHNITFITPSLSETLISNQIHNGDSNLLNNYNHKKYSKDNKYYTLVPRQKTFLLTNSIQTFTISYNGSYTFFVKGGRGGGSRVNRKGASLKATFYLEINQVLKISVGGMGVTASGSIGKGGGGGSFVWIDGETVPLIIAGGGGGGGSGEGAGWGGENSTNMGGSGGGGDGNGGTGGGGGGGGWNSDGGNGYDTWDNGAMGGEMRGVRGGAGGTKYGSMWNGGGGGGGGGYTGGRAGNAYGRLAEGGTSYIHTSNTNTETLSSSLNDDNDGSVMIQY